MKNNAIVITGSNGAAAQKLISYFADSFDVVIGITRHPVVEYDKQNIKVEGLNHKKMTLVDVGANIGSISIPALTRNYFSNAILFEPEIRNVTLLKYEQQKYAFQTYNQFG